MLDRIAVEPEPDSALEGLKPIEMADMASFKAAVTAGEQLGWAYYFPYLFARSVPGRSTILLGTDEGSVCVFLLRRRRRRETLDLLLAPAPMNVRVLERCLERANDHNGNFSARVMRIDEKDAPEAATLRHLAVRERKSQYLYDPHTFIDLRGRRYRTLRRQVALVEDLPDVEVLPFSPDHLAACRDLLRRWQRRHRESHGTAGGVRTSSRALDAAPGFPATELGGEVVIIGGRLSAFSLGGEIRPGVACYFEAKNDFDVPGLSYFLRRSYLMKLQGFGIVNDGSDTGRAGLRQLKDSLRPIGMHREFRGYQRGG